MLNYQNIKIYINNQPILADTLSLSQLGQQKPLYVLNNKNPVDYSPEGIKGSINLSYVMDISGEPSFAMISGIKENGYENNNNVCVIKIGEVNVVCYLSKFAFSIIPFQSIKAQATYDIFHKVTGNLINESTSNDSLFNINHGSGIPNYITSYFYSGNQQVLDSDILQMDYQFSANVLPIYSLGNPVPSQVYISEMSEVINTTSESQTNIDFSGKNFIDIYSGIDSIKIFNISKDNQELGYITFNLSGMKIQGDKVDINTNNIILFNNSFSQSF